MGAETRSQGLEAEIGEGEQTSMRGATREGKIPEKKTKARGATKEDGQTCTVCSVFRNSRKGRDGRNWHVHGDGNSLRKAPNYVEEERNKKVETGGGNKG